MILLQEELEKTCWLQANRLQTAPAQRMTDFVNGRLSATLNPSSYAPGLIASPLHFWLPEFITSRLREAFKLWGKQKHGFLTSEATVIGIETRTSSPVSATAGHSTIQSARRSPDMASVQRLAFFLAESLGAVSQKMITNSVTAAVTATDVQRV